jgi:thiosulfate/3-mercaptopyruvate sulfurtransferase
MRKRLACVFVLTLLLVVGLETYGADHPTGPVVSVAWLQKNLGNPDITVVDIRRVEDYRVGHIPGAVSLTFTAWRTMTKDLECQLPHKDDLNDTVCSIGLCKKSAVILVGKTDTHENCATVTRVAWTLKYAGILHPAILDGGYDEWVRRTGVLSTETVKPTKTDRKCEWNDSVVATKDNVKEGLGKVLLLDARPVEQFKAGATPGALKKTGHIPGAVNLPYTFVFKADGTFEDRAALEAHASRAVGEDKNTTIIALCCVGKRSSTWWFVLSEILGYRDVRLFDGSMEEWCRDKDAPLVDEDRGRDSGQMKKTGTSFPDGPLAGKDARE